MSGQEVPKPGQITHSVRVGFEDTAGREIIVGYVTVFGDPECDPIQVAATAWLTVAEAGLFTAPATVGHDAETFTTEQIKEWGA